ncbi:MAG: uracil-DNA glycosylase [Planctomycetota bacterium]
MASEDDPLALRRAAAACILEGLEEAGLDRIPHPVAASSPNPVLGSEQTAASASAPLEERIAACRACGLCESRTQTVPGEGAAKARILFLGEAPGAQEDQSGRPFVGPAGQLLEKILEGGMGLSRQEVYIANVLKCRPPGNRDPLPAEILACTPFLEEQIATIQPELIIALGRHAAHHLLKTDQSLSRLRGSLHHRPEGGPPVLVTYHPAYLLRNPAEKRSCWEDIQLGMRHLGMTKPGS